MTEKLQTPDESRSHLYSGKYSDYQLTGNSLQGVKYGKAEALTDYQNFLYNRALFGLSVYSKEELTTMRKDKRKRITKVHKKAQKTLNVWKQQIINSLSTHLFTSIFPNTPLTESIINTKDDIDPDYVNRMSFKSLHITKKQIIHKLLNEGILPPNFYELKTQDSCK